MENTEKRVRKSRRVRPEAEAVNCRCTMEYPDDLHNEEAVIPVGLMLDTLQDSINRLKSDILQAVLTPDRILKSGNVTIVFWNDGTKTIVKPESGATLDDYTAFTAALAKKIFGSNSKLKKVIKQNTTIQEIKKKKERV